MTDDVRPKTMLPSFFDPPSLVNSFATGNIAPARRQKKQNRSPGNVPWGSLTLGRLLFYAFASEAVSTISKYVPDSISPLTMIVL